MYGQLILQVVLILLNAFFAMTEIALISVNTARLKAMYEEGDKTAGKLLKISEDPSGFLSTIQIGITLAGFLGSAFAADNFSGYLVNWVYNDLGLRNIPETTLDTIAVVVITLILSYFTLIFGELVPKRIAMQKPMEIAKISCIPVSFISSAVRPVVWFLSVSTNATLRLMGMKTEAEEEKITEEEIRLMVGMGQESGEIEEDEREWIENVFDFGDEVVKSVMTRKSDVISISVDMKPDEIEKIIEEYGYSRYPVYGDDENEILGIMNAREFFIGLRNSCDIDKFDIRNILRPAYLVSDNMKAAVLFKDMQKNKTHIAIVIDEYGDNSGIVTMEDLIEEIVGNIYDEFDDEEDKDILKISETEWSVRGNTIISDLSDEIDVEFPENLPYDTVAGMVYSCLRTIPSDATGIEVAVHGIRIKVEKIENRKIEKAIVTVNKRTDKHIEK